MAQMKSCGGTLTFSLLMDFNKTISEISFCFFLVGRDCRFGFALGGGAIDVLFQQLFKTTNQQRKEQTPTQEEDQAASSHRSPSISSSRSPDPLQHSERPISRSAHSSRPPEPFRRAARPPRAALPEGSPRRVHPTARRFLSRQPAGQNLRRRRKPAGARCRPCRGLRKAKASAERGPPPPPPARSRSACRAQPPAQPGTKVAMATARVPPPRRGCNNSSARAPPTVPIRPAHCQKHRPAAFPALRPHSCGSLALRLSSETEGLDYRLAFQLFLKIITYSTQIVKKKPFFAGRDPFPSPSHSGQAPAVLCQPAMCEQFRAIRFLCIFQQPSL